MWSVVGALQNLKGSDKVAEKEGWIKTYRKIQDCWIWQIDKPFDERSAWIDLLLSANHKDVKMSFNGKFIIVKRGQFITSVRKLSEKWKWNKEKTLKFLRLLESDKMLKRDSDRFRTLLTIENYDIYQDCTDTERTQQGTQQGTQDGHEPATNKNEKNDKNIKESNTNVLPKKKSLCENEQSVDKKQDREKLENDFKIIYDSYPKKVGKTRGFELYKSWLKGKNIGGSKVKLTNKQIWLAIDKYKHELEENGTDKQYIKQFDTFMNKSILDYVEEEV